MKVGVCQFPFCMHENGFACMKMIIYEGKASLLMSSSLALRKDFVFVPIS